MTDAMQSSPHVSVPGDAPAPVPAPRTSLRGRLMAVIAVGMFLALIAALVGGRSLALAPVDADPLVEARLTAFGVVVQPATVVEDVVRSCPADGTATSATPSISSTAIGASTPRGAVIMLAGGGVSMPGPGTFVPTEIADDAVTYLLVEPDGARLTYRVVTGPNGGWVLGSSANCV